MNPERWARIEQIYHSALEQEPSRRDTFLSATCGADQELRREVESLLADAPTQTVVKHRMAGAFLTAGTQLGPYRILGPLGEGGMGKVYRALDTRLDRAVAIKISAEEFSQRFEREARAISALNHPNICTLYDVGSLPSGSGYMVTELVEGETLREWLDRAPSLERSLDIARQVLEALRAAHSAGIVHRDLKPANIMVRFDGYVKVLDFGLAKRTSASRLLPDHTVTKDLSLPGQMTGTVAYMSPEQILGDEIDQRSDLFAFGIVLYEMLTGEHPWPRSSSAARLQAILRDDPSPIRDVSLTRLAGVVQQLLRKSPAERYPSAEAVLEALASHTAAAAPRSDASADSGWRHAPRALTRLVVLPFRILRPHEATDFLAASLPDAIVISLAAIDSLVVRSMLLATRLAAPELDVKGIAEQAQVDAILTGTMLSDGEHLRVSTQLVEAPSGTVLWSNTSQVSLQDIFQLQDQLVDQIVRSLTLPLTAREQRALKHDVPANAMVYELYLRANQLANGGSRETMLLARDLYLRAVDTDPKYAPAWAGLGRTHRFAAKFGDDTAVNLSLAEEAFRKAFALNPELSLAHNFYTSLETDSGRSLDAMDRLLKRAHTHPNDPNLLAGLVQACRYCGLLEASVAAHDRARQLDPNIRTSVAYSYFHQREYQKAIDYANPADGGFVTCPSLVALGRDAEAIALAKEQERNVPRPYSSWATAYRALLEGDLELSLQALDHSRKSVATLMDDPEARFCMACLLAKLDQGERALEFLSIALDRRYCCLSALMHNSWLDSLRSRPQFTELLTRAAAMDLLARTVFLDNGGDRLLGVRVDRKPPGLALQAG